jgi:GNAT superfamily N-acetyltransferase
VGERLRIAAARRDDVGLILAFIKELAEYERLTHEVETTEAMIVEALFSARPVAEAVLAYWDCEPVGFAVYFTNFSTFSGRAGMYLEDLFVRPAARRNGIGRALLRHLASVCIERGYTRFQWSVLDWNQPAVEFYKSLGAVSMDDWTVFRLAGDPLADLAANRA